MRRTFRSTVLATLLAASWWQPVLLRNRSCLILDQATAQRATHNRRRQGASSPGGAIFMSIPSSASRRLGPQAPSSPTTCASRAFEAKNGVGSQWPYRRFVLRRKRTGGGAPCPDKDALPVNQPEGLPFASKAEGQVSRPGGRRDVCLRPRTLTTAILTAMPTCHRQKENCHRAQRASCSSRPRKAQSLCAFTGNTRARAMIKEGALEQVQSLRRCFCIRHVIPLP